MYNKVIEPASFPNFLESDEVKITPEFGLKVAKAIETEWFHRKNDSMCAFYDRKDKYHNLRLYARGEQSTKIYKDLMNGGDSSSYINYDWRPLQIAPKFVKLIVNQMSERLFNIKAEAVDKYSTDLKDTHKTALQNLIISKPILEEAKKTLNIDMFPDGFEEYPQSQEEIDLHMQIKYKPAIEIATEEAIKYTLELNDYDEIQNRVIEDITVLGIGAIKHLTDLSKGIMVAYVDPAMIVHSFARHRNHKDVFYYGEVERITVNELKRISQGKFTNDELKEIANKTSDFNNYQGNTNEGSAYSRKDDLSGVMVDVMHFTFKATNTITYKKKFIKNGGFKMSKKESTFDKTPYGEGYDVIKKTIDVWYEGTLILGTDFIFNYKLCENMIRPEGNLNITVPNYIVYAPELYQNRTRSLVERIIPYIDQMQQIHIKLQQLIAKSRPNGIYIDVDGLDEIDMGDGNFLTPLELIKIYDDTGNIIGTSSTAEGDYNYGRTPIQELKNGVVDGLDRLITAYNHYLNLLRDAIGVPQGADASMPHPDTLVGVQQQVVLNSNTATRHILDSSLNITRRLGQGLSLRLKDIFKYSDLKEVYTNAIGKANVEILKALDRYHLHDLGIIIELKPDIQEQQYLEANIQMALSKGLIVLDDAIDIRNIKNPKLANELLKIRRSRRDKEKKDHEKEIAKISGDSQSQAVMAAAQAKMAEIDAQTKSQLVIINAKAQADMQKIMTEKKAKSELMKEEFDYNMVMSGVKDEHEYDIHRYKEDRKDTRQDKQNTQSSKIAEQKANNLPANDFESPSPQPPKFESSEDNISGNIDMGELEPH